MHVVSSFGRSASLPLPPCLFSVLSVPSWGGWIILPCPLQLLSLAGLCHPGGALVFPCQLLPVERDAERKAQWLSPGIEQLLSFLGGSGEKAEHGAEPPATAAFGGWNHYPQLDQTLHMKVHFHQLQLSLHLFSSPSPTGSPDGHPASFLRCCLPTLHPAFQAWLTCTKSPLLGP